MALAAHKRARMELSNFLLRVEGSELDEGEEGPAREGTAWERLLHDDDDALDGGGGGTSSGAGADAGHAALTILPPYSTSTPSAAPQTLPKRSLSLLSPLSPSFDHSSHPPKRQRKEDDPRARRLTFHPSVVFRPQTDYRPSEAFQRTDKQNYVPGRNAPGPAADGAPSAFLDTSGHSLGASRFYLQKKTKRGWVSTAQAEGEDRVFAGLGEGGEGGEEGTSGHAVGERVPPVHGERDGAKAGVEKPKGVGLETGSDVLNERRQTLGDE
ncbi:hypothetical protein BS50DRAFT_577014 [Corynespora cassiicola Philippines]|uniref:Uncharacterized protein n=1 Tax=Corynespora cassiicola Philippines TaxID=1448308 RepID=A0A2T2NDD3_CORCC|nr:hypothetical protein BS50DRAFT_577014 [Corynespora cassiicola Philippines]